jgi:predicted phosphodiesterase
MLPGKSRLRRIDLGGRERVLIVGDLHGDLESYRKVEDFFDPSRDLLMFLGDYADRGSFGVEVIEGVDRLAKRHSSSVVALKGNHEDYRDGAPSFYPCDLIGEAELKRGGWRTYYDSFLRTFLENLHLAAKIGSILLVHGGVSSKLNSLNDLDHPTREVEEAVLWSDPCDTPGEAPNPRGSGVLFGEDVTEMVCRLLGIGYIIRSHEPLKAFKRPLVEHKGRIITVSSTNVYGGLPFILVLPTVNIPANGFDAAKYAVSLR